MQTLRGNLQQRLAAKHAEATQPVHSSAVQRDGSAPGTGRDPAVGEAAAQSAAAPQRQVFTSVVIDWWLWERGERERAAAPPHHRTLSIFY